VSVSRTRLPSWHHSKYEPEDDANDLFMGAPAYRVLAIALARSLFSSTRWVEAVCRDPAEIRIVWQTHQTAAAQVAQDIARRLSRGYENLTPPKAEFVSMTEPPGLEDHDV
jgi:hypothetical protein